MILRDAPAAIRAERIHALIVDQAEMASGTVAERLGLPFVKRHRRHPPLNTDESVPFFCFLWSSTNGNLDRFRNRLGNTFFKQMSWPSNRWRKAFQ